MMEQVRDEFEEHREGQEERERAIGIVAVGVGVILVGLFMFWLAQEGKGIANAT